MITVHFSETQILVIGHLWDDLKLKITSKIDYEHSWDFFLLDAEEIEYLVDYWINLFVSFCFAFLPLLFVFVDFQLKLSLLTGYVVYLCTNI